MTERSSKGGKARAEKLVATDRTRIAKKAAEARWGKNRATKRVKEKAASAETQAEVQTYIASLSERTDALARLFLDNPLAAMSPAVTLGAEIGAFIHVTDPKKGAATGALCAMGLSTLMHLAHQTSRTAAPAAPVALAVPAAPASPEEPLGDPATEEKQRPQ